MITKLSVKGFFAGFFLISVVAMAAYICFYTLHIPFLENWDEGFYAEVTKQMMVRKDFIPYWNGQYFFDKPPLNFWINSLFAVFFGMNEFAVRLPSALSGFVTILLVTWYAYRKWGLFSSFLAFITIALSPLFIWRIRGGNLDSIATLMIFVSFLLMTSELKRRYILLGLLFGLLYLQKTTLVAVPVCIFLIHEALYHRKELKKNIVSYISLFALFLGIDIIWLFIASLKAGPRYFYYFLFQSDQGVGKLSLEYFKLNYFFHLYHSLQRVFLVPYTIGLATLIWYGKRYGYITIFLFSTVLLVALSFTSRDNNWYLLPSIPFWSLAVGMGASISIGVFKKYPRLQKIVMILILIPSVYFAQKTFTTHITAIIQSRPNIPEVESALKIKSLSKTGDKIARLDHAYPVTIYYSDLKTYYYEKMDTGTLKNISGNKIRFAVGKKDKVDELIKLGLKGRNMRRIDLNDESIIQLF